MRDELYLEKVDRLLSRLDRTKAYLIYFPYARKYPYDESLKKYPRNFICCYDTGLCFEDLIIWEII
jgi:hypothetical protein